MDRGATKTNYGSSYRASGHEKHKAHLINCTVVTLLLLVVDRWREDRMEVMMAIELGCGAVHGRAACCSLQYERAKKIAADRKRGHQTTPRPALCSDLASLRNETLSNQPMQCQTIYYRLCPSSCSTERITAAAIILRLR